MMMYTRDEVCDENYFDCYDLDTLPLHYVKVTVSCSQLTIGSKEHEPITLHNWRAYEDYEGSKDIETIQRLMSNLNFPPLIVDETFYIIDGRHRLAALNTLGIKTTEVYFPA